MLLALDEPEPFAYTHDMEHSPSETGAALRQMRLEAGLSQVELAARLMCSRANVGMIESGHHFPAMQLLLAWTEACGRTVAFIAPAVGASLAAVRQQDQERVARLLVALGRLNDRQRAAVDALLLAFYAENDYKRAPEK